MNLVVQDQPWGFAERLLTLATTNSDVRESNRLSERQQVLAAMEAFSKQREYRQCLLEYTTADWSTYQGSGQVRLDKKPAEFS